MKKILIFIIFLMFPLLTVSAATRTVTYDFDILDNTAYNLETGQIYENDNYVVTSRIYLTNNVVDFSQDVFHHILLWDKNNKYLGYYNATSALYKNNKYLGDTTNKLTFGDSVRSIAFMNNKSLDKDFNYKFINYSYDRNFLPSRNQYHDDKLLINKTVNTDFYVIDQQSVINSGEYLQYFFNSGTFTKGKIFITDNYNMLVQSLYYIDNEHENELVFINNKFYLNKVVDRTNDIYSTSINTYVEKSNYQINDSLKNYFSYISNKTYLNMEVDKIDLSNPTEIINNIYHYKNFISNNNLKGFNQTFTDLNINDNVINLNLGNKIGKLKEINGSTRESKNLFNGNLTNGYLASDGTYSNLMTQGFVTDYIPVTYGNDYILKLYNHTYDANVYIYQYNSNYVSNSLYKSSGNTANNIIITPQSSTIEYIRLSFTFPIVPTNDYYTNYKNNLMINEGSTPLPYEDSSLKSVVNPSVKIVNENLFDEELELGKLSTTGTLEANNDYIRSKNYIPIKPNTTYSISHNGVGFASGYVRGYVFYDSNYNFISLSGTFLNFTTPANASYMKFYANVTTDLNYTIMLNTGTSPLPYVAHKETTALFNTTIRQWDKIKLVNGVYKKENGSTDEVNLWEYGSIANPVVNTTTYLYVFSNFVTNNLTSITSGKVNTFNWLVADSSDTRHVRYGGTGTVDLFMYVEKSLIDAQAGATLVDKLKAYLQSINAQFVGQKATTIDEDITPLNNFDLLQLQDNGAIYMEDDNEAINNATIEYTDYTKGNTTLAVEDYTFYNDDLYIINNVTPTNAIFELETLYTEEVTPLTEMYNNNYISQASFQAYDSEIRIANTLLYYQVDYTQTLLPNTYLLGEEDRQIIWNTSNDIYIVAIRDRYETFMYINNWNVNMQLELGDQFTFYMPYNINYNITSLPIDLPDYILDSIEYAYNNYLTILNVNSFDILQVSYTEEAPIPIENKPVDQDIEDWLTEHNLNSTFVKMLFALSIMIGISLILFFMKISRIVLIFIDITLFTLLSIIGWLPIWLLMLVGIGIFAYFMISIRGNNNSYE